MRNLHVSLPHLHSFREEFREQKLEIVPFEEQIMEDVPAVGSRESFEELHRSAGEAYRVESVLRKEPHVLAMIFVDQLARKRRLSLRLNDIPRRSEHHIDVMDAGGGPYDLWVDMGPGEQWLDHATFTPQRDWGGKIVLDRSLFSPAQDLLQADRNTRIRIDGVRVNEQVFEELRRRYPDRRLPASTPGVFDIEVNVMHDMVAGYAMMNPSPGVNVILMATRVYWRPRTPEQIISSLKHEMGHRIGMVPDGTASTCDLDSPQTYYQQRGHTGPHCSHGILQNPLPASLANQGENLGADCLMFGDDTGGSSLCSLCATAAKKVDLDQGFVSFADAGFPS
jgi:type VI secretion system secreted protein VgrG